MGPYGQKRCQQKGQSLCSGLFAFDAGFGRGVECEVCLAFAAGLASFVGLYAALPRLSRAPAPA
jgi:hypothetical protein